MLRRLALALLLAGSLAAQGADYGIARHHPRLLLSERRLQLLQRERERETMRWQVLAFQVTRDLPFPEPGFAYSLYYVAGGDESAGRRAIEWALENGGDVRQMALVFDWCQDLLTPAESEELVRRLGESLDRDARKLTLPEARDLVLAAVALAGHVPEKPEAALRKFVEGWWRSGFIVERERDGRAIPRNQTYALAEILHAVRDNTGIDLRLDASKYFDSFPVYQLLTYYPAIYPDPENDFRIPLVRDGSEPNLKEAALSRAADMALIAYDPNAVETQFLQGWVTPDRFLMRGAFGLPYEFLWANPYQPGLSYFSAPTVYHDPASGRLAVRSGWDGGDQWYYFDPETMQTFSEGTIRTLEWESLPPEIRLGGVTLVPLKSSNHFRVESGDEDRPYYLIGLEANTRYDVEVDDEELAEHTSDPAGIIAMEFPAGRRAGVRLRVSGALRP